LYLAGEPPLIETSISIDFMLGSPWQCPKFAMRCFTFGFDPIPLTLPIWFTLTVLVMHFITHVFRASRIYELKKETEKERRVCCT